jgi:hypothetical protein
VSSPGWLLDEFNRTAAKVVTLPHTGVIGRPERLDRAHAAPTDDFRLDIEGLRAMAGPDHDAVAVRTPEVDHAEHVAALRRRFRHRRALPGDRRQLGWSTATTTT